MLTQKKRLSLTEVAKLLDVHVATCWRWAKRGVRGRKLPTFTIGGRRYVEPDQLFAFLTEPQHAGQADLEATMRSCAIQSRDSELEENLMREGL